MKMAAEITKGPRDPRSQKPFVFTGEDRIRIGVQRFCKRIRSDSQGQASTIAFKSCGFCE